VRSREARNVFTRLAELRGEHPTWGELFGSLVVLVGLGLALGVVDVRVPRRTAARVPAPTPTPRN